MMVMDEVLIRSTNGLRNHPGAALHTEEHPRLSDALFRRGPAGFDRFQALPTNVKAVEACVLFASGLRPFVAILGPSGWGKSHLLHSVAELLRRENGLEISPIAAREWIENGPRVDLQLPLLLDDLQDTASGPRQRQLARMMLERRVKAGRPTLLAIESEKGRRLLRHVVPGLRDWTQVSIQFPTPTEREQVLQRIAASDGLLLAPALMRVIARRVGGNGRTLAGALRRLGLQKRDWLTEESVVRACGILSPHFHDGTGWDLREFVKEVVQVYTRRHPVPHLTEAEFGMFLLLRVLDLPEKEVAEYYDVTQGHVYLSAQHVAECLSRDAEIERAVQGCTHFLAHELGN